MIAGVLAAAVLLGDLVGLDRRLPFAVFTALRPQLTVATAAVAVLVLVLARSRPAARAAGAALLLVAVVSATLLVPRLTAREPVGAAGPGDGTALTLLSFNVFEGAADPAALAALVGRERPDLVVLPEAADSYRARIAALLPGYRSWSTAGPGVGDVRGVTVLASPRAGDVAVRRLPDDTRYPWAEVTGGILGGTRLAAVHLVAPVPDLIGYWPGELESLRQWCAAPGPTLVAGDFNASADHSAFRAGTAGCADTGAAAGTGLVPTWRSSWPPWFGTRIDHVLLHRGPRPGSDEVIAMPGSDHRAVLARVRL